MGKASPGDAFLLCCFWKEKKNPAAVFSTGLSLMLFAVTHYLENYVTAIAWALPAVGAAAFFCGILLYAFGEIVRGKWTMPLTGAPHWAWGYWRPCSRAFGLQNRDMYI